MQLGRVPMLQGAKTIREGCYIILIFIIPLLTGKGILYFDAFLEVVDMDSGPLPNSNRKKSNNKSGTIIAAFWPLVPRRRLKNAGNHYEVNRGEQI